MLLLKLESVNMLRDLQKINYNWKYNIVYVSIKMTVNFYPDRLP